MASASKEERLSSKLRLYGILNLVEPPRLLMNDCERGQFFCYFGLPLPKQIIIFRLGDSCSLGYDTRMSIDVCLDNETPSFRIGYLEKNTHSVCHQPQWPETFLNRSHMFHEKDCMAKLLLTIEGRDRNGFRKEFSHVTPEKFEQLEKRELVIRLSNKITPPVSVKASSTLVERPSKKLKNDASLKETAKPKRKRVFSCGDSNGKNNIIKTPPTSSMKPCMFADSSEASTKSNTTYESNTKADGVWPSGRWGHSGCAIGNGKVAIIGGQGENYQMVKDSLYVLDYELSSWEEKNSSGSRPDRRMGHTSTFDPVKKVIYVFGGSKNKRWFKDVHVLDIQTWEWTNIKTVGIAPRRAYHASVLYQGELFVFGGVYPNPDPTPDGCSNDLYIFNPEKNSWYQPIVMGEVPSPRSGHTLELYSENKVILFGGWDAPKCHNDVYILDLELMEFMRPDVTGVKPKPRSWHSSTLLGCGSQLLIHGGFDGDNNVVLGDWFIFDIGKLTWLKVNTDPPIQPSVGHVMFSCKSTADGKGRVMVFGGGDNEGKFFDEFLTVKVFTEK